MQIEIDAKIGEKGPWAEGVRRANEILLMVLGRSAELVKVTWELKQDNTGRPVFSLALCDFSGVAIASFAPEEMQNSERLWYRLERLWGDLLQVRSHKQLEDLMKPDPVGKDA